MLLALLIPARNSSRDLRMGFGTLQFLVVKVKHLDWLSEMEIQGKNKQLLAVKQAMDIFLINCFSEIPDTNASISGNNINCFNCKKCLCGVCCCFCFFFFPK